MQKNFRYIFAILFLSILALQQSLAQNLPDNMRFAENEHIIYTGDQAPQGLYDATQIRVFQLWFSQPDYWQTLKNNYASKTDLPAMLIADGDTFPNVGVRFKGQTSYSQAQTSDKKSFNITMDYADSTQNLMGYETINLNNAFQDASFMREVAFLHLIRQHVPAASASYVQLYINGNNWGIYPNVQQLNRDYLKEWYFSNDGTLWRADRPVSTGGNPGWGDGTAGLNYLGPDTATYKPHYTLKSTDKATPWDDLVQVCQVLNTTPLNSLESEISEYLDLDRTLWFLASEIAFSDDDSYIFKGKMDYYIYWDPETQRMTPLEFDGNSVMKSNTTSWGVFYNETKVNYPLLNKLLAVPSIRQRYLAHMRTLVQDELDQTKFNALVDKFDALISAGVMADPKKMTTNAQYTTEKQTIKNYVQNHRTTLLNHPEMGAIGPVIANTTMRNAAGGAWISPVENESANVTTTVTSQNGIAGVFLYFCPALNGNFAKIQMFDDGQHQDGAAGDGVFGINIPGYATGTYIRFYVEAKSANTPGTLTYAPAGAEHNVYYYRVAAPWAPVRNVVVNEIMASNSSTAADEEDQYEDWIELHNLTNAPLDLSGYYLSDNASTLDKWSLPANTVIPANGYLIVWADEDGSQGPLHANFKLSASGESITFADNQKRLLDTLSFTQQVKDMGYARVPNGTGPFVIQAPTFKAANSTVAALEPFEQDWLKAFPSIVTDYLQVELSGVATASARILDMQGKLLLERNLSGVDRLDLSGLAAGSYALQVLAEGKSETLLFVKK
jgi:CotH kinase protein/Lamin Tail Domain